jgi:O-antigen ligase
VGPFRHTAPTRTLNFAHNEPLQLLAEGGIVALGFALTGLFLLFRRIREAWPSGSRRLLPMACTLSLTGALLHSLVDFSLEIPACALAFSWVAGMAAGLRFSPVPKTPGDARR